MKISKKVMREIYDIKGIIDDIGNTYNNDRDSQRADKLLKLVRSGQEKCQKLIDSEDPL